jgi:hypothetical protein
VLLTETSLSRPEMEDLTRNGGSINNP